MKKIFFLVILISLHSCMNEPELYEVMPISGVMPCIIVAGQSNAEGFAPVYTAPDWLRTNDNKLNNYAVWDKDHNTFSLYRLGVNVGSENNSDWRFGFDVFFAKRYIEYFNAPLLCIKQTMPAIPISEKGVSQKARWQPDANLVPKGERSMVIELNDKIRLANEYAKKNNATLKFIAILYLQGEADANYDERLIDYKDNFTALKAYLRELVGDENTPFINAEIFYRNDKYKQINTIFRELNQIDNTFFRTVNTSEYQTSIGDNLHYDANAQQYIGNSMFDYYLKLK